jgi:uncharacterized membrane protein YvbJ
MKTDKIRCTRTCSGNPNFRESIDSKSWIDISVFIIIIIIIIIIDPLIPE